MGSTDLRKPWRAAFRKRTPRRVVFAVHGPWGSGKSSACNLILYHLNDDIASGRLVPVTFNPWWFTGREALTLAFFQELGASIGRSLSDQAREALALGVRLSSAGSLLGSPASVFGLPGAVVENAATTIGGLTKIDQTVEEVHKKSLGRPSPAAKKIPCRH